MSGEQQQRPMYTESETFIGADINTVVDEIAEYLDLRKYGKGISTYELLRRIREQVERAVEDARGDVLF